MIRLLIIELLKLRRSLALFMIFATPFLVALIQLLLITQRVDRQLPEQGWSVVWQATIAIWCFFMLPLFVALSAALICGVEHKQGGWRWMMLQPVRRWQFFLAKVLIVWMMSLSASLVLIALTALNIAVLQALGFKGAEPWNYPWLIQFGIISIAILPIVVIQTFVAWRWANIAVPLGTGVAGTFTILQMGSSKYWVWTPWTYTLIATSSNQVVSHISVPLLATLVASVVLVVCLTLLRRDRRID